MQLDLDVSYTLYSEMLLKKFVAISVTRERDAVIPA